MTDGNTDFPGRWGPAALDVVVRDVERRTVGRRGALVRTLAAPEQARYAWTERLHRLVLEAICAATGEDLEEHGSQAAWECYDQVWRRLADRWAHGGSLAIVAPHQEAAVVALIERLPVAAAEAAAADVSVMPAAPLWLAGRLRVDVEGLWAYLATVEPPLTGPDRARVDQVIARASPVPASPVAR